MSETTITVPANSQRLELSREFDAPRELLFRAYSEPELVARWLGPRRLTMTVHRLDMREGGGYRYTHTDSEGNEFSFHGVYHGTPSAAAGIVQTFEFEGAPGEVSLETVTFEERDGRTLIRQSTVFQSVESRDNHVASGMETGVRDSMDRLAELLATLAPAH